MISRNNGFTVEDIILFYKTLRRYKDHDNALKLCVNHFKFKISTDMTEREFRFKVESVINKALNS